MQIIRRYCDVCGVETDYDGKHACETKLTLTTPFKVLRWNRDEVVTANFAVCRGCESKISKALEAAAGQYRDAWLSVVNTYGLGKSFKREGER